MIRRIATLAVILSLGALTLSSADTANAQSGFETAFARVVNILDGDTIDVEYISGGEGLPTRLQMYAMNAPDYSPGGAFIPPNEECYGQEAIEVANGLLLNNYIWISHQNLITEVSLVDRLHAYVYLDSDRVSLYQAMMISQGAAVRKNLLAEEQFLFPRFIQLENEANLDDRGLWAECDPRLYQDS